jgi:hypothetical protein
MATHLYQTGVGYRVAPQPLQKLGSLELLLGDHVIGAQRLHASKFRLGHFQTGMPHIALRAGCRYRRRRAQPRLRFRNTLLGFTRGNLCTTQRGTGALGIRAGTLLRELHLDLGPTQVGGRHSHGCFHLFDPRLKVTRVELSEDVIGVDCLVVDDVDGQNRAIDLRTQRDDITDDVGIVCRFMRLVILSQLPAIGDTDT